jgi:hypothetical protein
LTGAALDALKLWAMVLMVIDHANIILLDEGEPWMFYLGRGCYPLFAFAMAISLNRDKPLDGYLKRLVVFALLSQPVFVLAFHENALNILFTLALGAAVARWYVEQVPWRRHGFLCVVVLSSFFFEDAIDFDLIGIMLPAVLLSAMRGERHARLWAGITLLALNLDMAELFALEDGQIALMELSWAPLLIVAGTVLVPWVSYALCRRVPGDRFLPRYALYWFYPGHLLVFALWRLLRDGLPLELISL